MRVLFVALPLVGHTLPMLPVATAMQAAGHEVRVATGGDALVADSGGVPFDDISGSPRPTRPLRIVLGHPVLSARVATGRGGGPGAAMVLTDVNAATVEPVRALAARWRPDVVVHDPMAIAAPVVAAELGVPTVLHGNALMDVHELRAAVLERHRLRGLPPPALAIDISPPSVVGGRPGQQPLRTMPWSGDGKLPDWLARPSERPRIVVSRSTIEGGPPGGDPMPAVIRAADAVDAEIVLVRSPRTSGLPDNVRAVGWVPLDQVLPHCAAVVHHGGAGTTLGAFVAGVPQLLVPGIGDRRYNAQRVAARGAGLAAPARRITAELLNQLLTDPAIGTAADEVRREIAELPEPAGVVARIEDVVAARA